MHLQRPLYEALALDFAQLITTGAFRPGDRLPSVRRTSRERRLSISTVTEAYRRLEDQGLIEARERSGYFVRARNLCPTKTPRPSQAGNRPIEVGCASIFASVMEAVANPHVTPFGAAVPSDAIVPSARLASISAAMIRRHGPQAFLYSISPGRKEFRAALSKRLLAAGITATPDDIVITTGATEAIILALRATTKPGDLVAVETPTFFGILNLVRDLGLKVIELPVCPVDGVDLQAVEEAAKMHPISAVVVQPNFQNPLGSLMPVERKQQLANLSVKHGFSIIEDDLYGDLAYDGSRPAAVASMTDRVIYIGAASKTIAPGLRIGWMVPGRHLARVKALKAVHSPAGPTLSEMIMTEFLEAGGCDRHLRRVRSIYREQSLRVREAILTEFPDTCRINQPRGSFLLWVEMEPDFDAEAFARSAFAEGISLVPGSIFSPSCGLTNCFRISCGFPVDDRAMKAIKTLGRLARRGPRS